MHHLTLTQLTETELRSIIQSELSAFFLTHQPQEKPEQDDFGDTDLAAAVTGLAKSTIYSLASKKMIPHSKQGKRLYFRRSELLDWIRAGRRKTQDEIRAEAHTYTSTRTGLLTNPATTRTPRKF